MSDADIADSSANAHFLPAGPRHEHGNYFMVRHVGSLFLILALMDLPGLSKLVPPVRR